MVFSAKALIILLVCVLYTTHQFYLSDFDNNGKKDLVSLQDSYVAKANGSLLSELVLTSEELTKAADIAATRYKLYTDLAYQLIELSEHVARLGDNYCDYANQLGGKYVSSVNRNECENDRTTSQADHLNTIISNSEMAEAGANSAYLYYWQRRDTDANDHTLSETLGNGLVNNYHHDISTGRPSLITTHKANKLVAPSLPQSLYDVPIRYLEYQYDQHNNVTHRYDRHLGIHDTWEYDGLDRVRANHISLDSALAHGGVTDPDFIPKHTYRYDALGNITYKSGVGHYQYGQDGNKPHAVVNANGLNYRYDLAGNMIGATSTTAGGGQQYERQVQWSPFNKPTRIIRNNSWVEFKYDANHSRYLKSSSSGAETFYFGKVYERTLSPNGEVQHKNFIYADGKLVALNTQTDDSSNKLKQKQVRYLHYDALGSVDMISDGFGQVVEYRSYDTWGKQRGITWQNPDSNPVAQAAITNRGFTGHEEIDEVRLTHMNGRVYDSELARFISPDPIIQAPYQTNSFNRYAYVWNNPLKYTDPTGYTANDSWNQPYYHHPLGHGEPGDPQSANGRVSSSQQSTTRGNSGQYFDADRSAAEKVTTPYSDNQTSDTLPQNQVEDWKNPTIIKVTIAGELYNVGTTHRTLQLLDAKARDEYADAIETGTALGMIVASFYRKGRGVGAKYVTNKVHGNSKLSQKAQHVYEIRNNKTCEVVKTGISQGKISKKGKSYRAERQRRKWGKDDFDTTIVAEIPAGPGARQKALDIKASNARGRRPESLTNPDYHVRP
ncbi:RHS repeat-associated core domain-containing protein [Vibrio maritimus]